MNKIRISFMLILAISQVNIYAQNEVEKPWYNYISASLSISELEYKKENEEYELDWGVEVSNFDQQKYEIDFLYDSKFNRVTDAFEKTTNRESSHDLNLEVDVNNIFGKLGYTSAYSLNQERENSAYTTKYDIAIAPLGIKFDFYEGETLTELSLSLLPKYAYLETDDREEDDDGNIVVTKSVERSLNTVLRFEIGLSFFDDNLTINNDMSYTNVDPFDETIESDRDYNFLNTLTFDYELNDFISLNYQHDLEFDGRRKKEQLLPSTYQTHTFSLEFNWN